MCRFANFVVILIIVYASTKAQESNPLNEKHLRVITMEFPISFIVNRNVSGHIVGFSGVLQFHLKELSKMFNFSFTYLPTLVATVDDILVTRGGISYLISGEADFFLSPAVATPSRFKYVDFPASWYNGPFGLIVPFPKETLNLKASLKPFSYVVWITIFLATLAIILSLWVLGIKWSQNSQHILIHMKNKSTRRIVTFVLGNLVSQGQGFHSNQLAYRIAGGAWCAGCFFLIQTYCSTLTSHLTTPNQMPIVNSLEELAKTHDVDLTIDTGLALDTLLKSTKTGIYKNLVDKLKKDTNLRCNVTADCLERVRNGHTAYSAPVNNLKEIVARDLKKSGSCTYYMIKESYLSSFVFNMLPKNSPYTNSFTTGTLRFHQFGFYDEWFSWFLSEPRRCKKLPRAKAVPRLSLAHLSSAFLVLIAGYIISIIIFISEEIFYHFRLSSKV